LAVAAGDARRPPVPARAAWRDHAGIGGGDLGLGRCGAGAFLDNRFRPGVDQVIRVHSEDVGLLSIEDRPDELFLGLVQLAPAWQQRGIGTSILRRLLADASAAGKPFTLQVLRTNAAAFRLYRREGLEVVGETTTHLLMSSRTGRI
jgi:ribosomal protein S18 acetylase RimI-like enzyme